MSYYNNKKKSYGKPKKKSGCAYKSASQTANNVPCIYGWNKSKTRGFISFVACPSRKEVIVPNSHGKEYEKWVATITYNGGLDKKTFTAFFDPDSKKLRIPDLRMTASPTTNYFGGWSKK